MRAYVGPLLAVAIGVLATRCREAPITAPRPITSLPRALDAGESGLIGADNLYTYLQRFGFGVSTHSGMGGESEGLVRTNAEPNWYSADLASNSFGQGIAATPLQVVTAFSAVINGGNLMRPYLIKETDGPAGRREYEPVLVRQAISPQLWRGGISEAHRVPRHSRQSLRKGSARRTRVPRSRRGALRRSADRSAPRRAGRGRCDR